MNPNLKAEERELVKLVQYFKKRAEILIIENKLDDEYSQMLDTCDKLVERLYEHAEKRQTVLSEREQLQGMVRDNARCPKCNSAEMLKVIGFDTTPQGWKSNKYKCRKCNIAFVWNTPNNPWDMIPYVEKFISDTEQKLSGQTPEEQSMTVMAIEQMKQNMTRLKPVVDASDLDMKELDERELQMSDLVRKLKKHLLIEKIKMED